MKTVRRWAAVAAMGVFLLCAAGLLWLLWLETSPHREPAYLTPEPAPGGPAAEELLSYAGPLTLSYVLPAWTGRQRPMIEVRSLTAAAELRLDGRFFAALPAGVGWMYLTLPPDCAGQTLTLVMEKGAEDALPSLFLTDDWTLYEQDRADACYYAFPTAAYGLAALLTLGLFLYGAVEGQRSWPVLLLCAAALGRAAVCYLANLPNAGLPPALYGLVMYQSRALLFAAPPLYLLWAMRKRRRLFAPFAIVPAAVYWVVAGFQTVVPLFSTVAVYAGVVFLPAVGALLLCAVLEFRDGNPVFRRVLPWLLSGGALAAVLCAVLAPQVVQKFVVDIGMLYLDAVLCAWSTLLLLLCFFDSAAAHIRRTAEREAELQAFSVQKRLVQEQLTTVQESAAALGMLRHEVKNHYLVLQNLYRKGEGERLDAYLGELVSEVTAIPSMACAPHPAINAVLTAMLARAQKQGVETERRVEVPETLPFPDTELCTVLMNLLQNALEANALAPEGARRWLRVDLYVHGVHLYIGVENTRFAPVDYDEESGLCRTTKTDRSAHGYGLKAVQAVARKYHSELLLQFPEGRFSAATALQMPD